MKILHLGFNNIVIQERVVSVVGAGSNPVKRLIEQAKQQEKLIDATAGRKTRSVVITDAGFIILSALQPQRIIERLESEN
jgi:regulator of extracellular matrix RemA (YlzA/DUF370 family)